MQTRTSDLLFGTGRTSLGQGLAVPEEPVRFGDLLGTMRGRDRVEEALRSQLPSRRSAAQEAADLLGSAEPTRNLIAGGGATATGAAALGAGQVEYANPIYGGLYAQSLIRDHGFVPPLAAGTPAGATTADDVVDAAAAPVRAVAADAPVAPSSTIGAAADEVAKGIVESEQRMMAAIQRVGELPTPEYQIAALQRAVDATAQHGGDTYEVLARTLVERPLEVTALALERAVDDLTELGKTPVPDDAARVATSAAPVVDEAAKATKVAAPVVDDAAKVAKVAAPAVQRAPFVPVPGLMSFKDGIDDTLRLLARI